MDCKTFQELISAAVDLRLTDGETAAFKEHGRLCPPCQYEYSAEAATKRVVEQHAHRAVAPDWVARNIKVHLQRKNTTSNYQSLLDLLQRPFVKPVIGFALAFASILILLKGSTSDSPVSQASLASNDVILQSLTNYRAVMDGQIKPQVMSGQPAQMESLFAGITDYSVHMPKMKDCTLLGAVKNEYAGTNLAHLLYQHDREIVYVYQTCLATVMKGDKLHLSDEAKDCLKRTGWFTESEPDGRTVVLWTKGRTLCAAVARMTKDDLVACLVSGEDHW